MSDFNANLAALLAILERDHLVVTDIENDAAWPVNAHVIDTIAQAQSLTRELEEAKEALKPFADAANTLDMEDIEGFPFDDPREVLWAGEGGTITVAEFRRAQALVTRLSRARSDSTETEAPAE